MARPQRLARRRSGRADRPGDDELLVRAARPSLAWGDGRACHSPAALGQGVAAVGDGPADTVLWRVHERRWPVAAFNPNGADPWFGGGPFERRPARTATATSTPPLSSRLRCSRPWSAAFRLTRKRRPAHQAGRRQRVSAGRAAADPRPAPSLRSRTHIDLAAVCQDEWLLHADPPRLPADPAVGPLATRAGAGGRRLHLAIPATSGQRLADLVRRPVSRARAQRGPGERDPP